ncbi:hypothetical protein AYO20_05159 [Fonsecaea nubica]|uniref:Uncharacterized protein n=1 Tax=Fonsecaea nubica TaxID=856822 RepID=A0A178D055_9EURO|nr:hypothetical protein AYO20_05159 [Fonsecaea nubica]OAL35540.1 hypothetical protein AYO20_05159 [Fonsecaea nubica]
MATEATVLRKCERHEDLPRPTPIIYTISDDEDTDDHRPSPPSPMVVTISDDEDVPDLVETGTESHGAKAHTSAPRTRPRGMMPNPLKRPITEDSLFFARKKFHFQPERANAAMQILRQETRNNELQDSVEAETQEAHDDSSNRAEFPDTVDQAASIQKPAEDGRTMSHLGQGDDDETSKSSTNSHAVAQGSQILSPRRETSTRIHARGMQHTRASDNLPDPEKEAKLPSMISRTSIEFLTVQSANPIPTELVVSSWMRDNNFPLDDEHALFVPASTQDPDASAVTTGPLEGRTSAEGVKLYGITKENANHRETPEAAEIRAEARAPMEEVSSSKYNAFNPAVEDEAPVTNSTQDTTRTIAIQKVQTAGRDDGDERQAELEEVISGGQTNIVPERTEDGSDIRLESLTDAQSQFALDSNLSTPSRNKLLGSGSTRPKPTSGKDKEQGNEKREAASAQSQPSTPSREISLGSGSARPRPTSGKDKGKGSDKHEAASAQSRPLAHGQKEPLGSGPTLSRPTSKPDEHISITPHSPSPSPSRPQPTTGLTTESISPVTDPAKFPSNQSAPRPKPVAPPVNYPKPTRPVSGKNTPTKFTDADQAVAIKKLRAKGVEFEPDSEGDEPSDPGTPERPPPRNAKRPCAIKAQDSRNLYEVVPSLDPARKQKKRG